MLPTLHGVLFVSKRIGHLRAVEQYDPTPEETAKAERAKPSKRPLCAKCKNFPRLEIWETVAYQINGAFRKIDSIMKSLRFPSLSRDDIVSLKRSHALLARASKAQYCKGCVTSTVTHVLDIVEKMTLRAIRPTEVS
jgi:hypothetical protein